MNLIKRGAEADIYRTEWFGRPAIVKARTPKPYRNEQLDGRIRRRRTIREADMLHSVKALGIRSPLVYFVDVGGHSITMEDLGGTTVHSMPDETILSHCAGMGRAAGLLHSAGIMHGDLTTSNFVYNGRLCLIDMGLSRRTPKPEDWAVDMRLIKEILGSAHARIMEPAWDRLISGYCQSMPEWRRVLALTARIESRGRYARVV